MTKGQRMRKRFGSLPIAGPSACFRSAGITRPCSKCGAEANGIMHSPLRVAGVFCGKCCCPVCNPTVAGNPAEVMFLQGAKA